MDNTYIIKYNYFKNVMFRTEQKRRYSLPNWIDELSDFYDNLFCVDTTKSLGITEAANKFEEFFKASFINPTSDDLRDVFTCDDLMLEDEDDYYQDEDEDEDADISYTDEDDETDFMRFMKNQRSTMTEIHCSTDFSNETYINFDDIKDNNFEVLDPLNLTTNFDDNSNDVKEFIRAVVNLYGIEQLKTLKTTTQNIPPPPPPPLPMFLSSPQKNIKDVIKDNKNKKGKYKLVDTEKENSHLKINEELNKLFESARAAKGHNFSFRLALNGGKGIGL